MTIHGEFELQVSAEELHAATRAPYLAVADQLAKVGLMGADLVAKLEYQGDAAADKAVRDARYRERGLDPWHLEDTSMYDTAESAILSFAEVLNSPCQTTWKRLYGWLEEAGGAVIYHRGDVRRDVDVREAEREAEISRVKTALGAHNPREGAFRLTGSKDARIVRTVDYETALGPILREARYQARLELRVIQADDPTEGINGGFAKRIKRIPAL